MAVHMGTLFNVYSGFLRFKADARLREEMFEETGTSCTYR